MIDARHPRSEEPSVGAPAADRSSTANPVRDLCPYLVAGDGGWRSTVVRRDQRCGAVRPSASLSVDKQRQLCLTPGHQGCATYLAASDLDAAAAGGAPPADDSLLWPAARSVPIVLEPAQRGVPGLALRGPRTAAQLVLAAFLLIAFAIVVISRAAPPAGGGASAGAGASADVGGASPTPTMTVSEVSSPSPAPTASPTASPSLTPGPSLTPAPPTATPAPTASPAPTGSQTYTVRSGDTLSGIAARFGTTVKILVELNDIADPRLIRVGQVLIIP